MATLLILFNGSTVAELKLDTGGVVTGEDGLAAVVGATEA